MRKFVLKTTSVCDIIRVLVLIETAEVLGDVTIGDNSVIGGNVWLTESLLPGTKVTALPPENKLKMAGERKL